MSTSFARAVLVIAILALCTGFVMGAAAGEEEYIETNEGRKMVFHAVREGETLYGIAEKNGVSLQSLIRANKLSKTVIHPKQVLIIPGAAPDFEMALSRGFTRDDIILLARAIYAEARGESFTGQVAVGAVILNRLESREFPDTLREIIMQKHSGTYQFTPVQDGSISLDPDDTAICAAIQAIAGLDPTNGALFFYNPDTASDPWIKTLEVQTRIGNHVFASKT